MCVWYTIVTTLLSKPKNFANIFLIYRSDDGITAALEVPQKNLSPYRPGELLSVGELFGTHGSIKHPTALSPALPDQPRLLEDCLCVSAFYSSAYFTPLGLSSLRLSDLIVHPQLQSSVKRLYPPYFSSVNSWRYHTDLFIFSRSSLILCLPVM